ncbi:uncharacterized protein LOC135714035 [Ochlerotatus camptorhynchus]|uniref:uncharacterized protein LOC135714035 n=1 Tax=Ochlerotatus camptorhynchus TaxID=644619 RepID=UPI0031D6D3C0
MVPIHKTGNLNRVENYRGISILCCLGKVFEKLVHQFLYNASRPLICEFQHGFVERRSTTTNLMCYTNTLFHEVEARSQVDSVYVDVDEHLTPYHTSISLRNFCTWASRFGSLSGSNLI